MRLSTVAQAKAIDERSQREFELPGDVLMEAAGAVATREIQLSYFPEIRRGGVGIICGPGNNGGDGLVIARHLHSAGVRRVCVYLVAPQNKRSTLFDSQLRRCKKAGVTLLDLERTNDLSSLQGMSLFVDAIFGIGFRGKIESPYLDVVRVLNALKKPIVSLDVPSGLDADRGTFVSECVRATQTLSFGLAKPGFFVNQGPERVGRLRILPIGFPNPLVREVACDRFAMTEDLVRRALPRRGATKHKSDFGHALILAGSSGMWGAGLLSASTAYRSGAGYVTLASHDEPLEILKDAPEILTAKADEAKLWDHRKWTAAAVGPGLGVSDETEALIKKLLEIEDAPVVADADAITVIAQRRLYPLPKHWILTPHAGELSRLISVSAKEIEQDRFRFVEEAQRKAGCIVLLKGFRTVIADSGSDKKISVILSGNSSLAKAGTGDVLTGLIAGLLAQKISPWKAANCAAFIHGKLADEWLRAGGDRRSLQASDLREMLPTLLHRLARSARVG